MNEDIKNPFMLPAVAFGLIAVATSLINNEDKDSSRIQIGGIVRITKPVEAVAPVESDPIPSESLEVIRPFADYQFAHSLAIQEGKNFLAIIISEDQRDWLESELASEQAIEKLSSWIVYAGPVQDWLAEPGQTPFRTPAVAINPPAQGEVVKQYIGNAEGAIVQVLNQTPKGR